MRAQRCMNRRRLMVLEVVLAHGTYGCVLEQQALAQLELAELFSAQGKAGQPWLLAKQTRGIISVKHSLDHPPEVTCLADRSEVLRWRGDCLDEQGAALLLT